MSSHRKFNYSLRPAKNIERKMICEALQRLSHFAQLNTYRYVGFGSRYFSDFALFHKSLGIRDMISIEKEANNKQWFDFNKPYQCIEMRYGNSSEILPELSWNMLTILWLDYDGSLEESVFADMEIFCSKAVSGSIILITVNADSGNNQNFNNNTDALENFRSQIGENRTPTNLTSKDITKANKPNTCRKIINNEILAQLSTANRIKPDEDRLNYHQLFNFVYSDGAQMLTTGGIVLKASDEDTLKKCFFSDFDFIKPDESNYRIEVPNLTFREIHYLNQQLPLGNNPIETFIPQKEIEQYSKIYRYFPAFTEAEV